MPDPANWTEAELHRTAAKKTAEENAEKIDVDLIDPGKCQTDHGWDNWKIAFTNKLSATTGVSGSAVNYVIQPDIEDADELFMEDDEVRLYQIPLKGPAYKQQVNRLVYSMLKAACVETDACWAWIQGHDTTYDKGRPGWPLSGISTTVLRNSIDVFPVPMPKSKSCTIRMKEFSLSRSMRQR